MRFLRSSDVVIKPPSSILLLLPKAGLWTSLGVEDLVAGEEGTSLRRGFSLRDLKGGYLCKVL